MIIGVFDSGVGGLSVSNALEKAFPDHTVLFIHDEEHFPYATKEPEAIFGFVLPLLNSLVELGCSVIVIACNTVSTTILDKLQQAIRVPLIGVEPMIEQAAQLTKTNIIAVCATPTTLKSPRYAELKSLFTKYITVLEPDCSDWSSMIEHDRIDKFKISHQIESVLNENADVIILGCTHYHWIETDIIDISNGRALVIHPEQLIVKQVHHVLT